MRRRNQDPIDAGAAIEEREEGRLLIEGERGGFKLGGQRRAPPGAKGFLLVSGVAVAAIAGVLAFKAVEHKPASKEKTEAAQTVKNPNKGFKAAALTDGEAANATELEPATPAGLDVSSGGLNQPIQPVPLTAGGSSQAQTVGPPTMVDPQLSRSTAATPSAQRPLTAREVVHLRRLGGDLGAESRGQVVAEGPRAPQGQSQGAAGELEQALKPLRLSAEDASKLGNRDFLLTKGAMLDCALETRIESTVAGMTSCHLTRDIYSTNGRVVLLDRGSKVVGFYQGGLRQGERRIFVQWSRVETPKGVIINLDSPGTGPLGEGGVDGRIDTHFGERFGGAILLSLINDLGDYFANKGRDSNTVSFSNSQGAGQELARTTLGASINIPPTLYKNQGERIAIFVARDLNFERVYGLASTRR